MAAAAAVVAGAVGRLRVARYFRYPREVSHTCRTRLLDATMFFKILFSTFISLPTVLPTRLRVRGKIPSSGVGMLMGKGGANIKRLEQTVCVYICVRVNVCAMAACFVLPL